MATPCSECGFDCPCPLCDGPGFTAGYVSKSGRVGYEPRDFRFEKTPCFLCNGTGLAFHSCEVQKSIRSILSL